MGFFAVGGWLFNVRTFLLDRPRHKKSIGYDDNRNYDMYIFSKIIVN